MEVEINTDKNLLDVKFIQEFLASAIWTKNRTYNDMQNCIKNSLNFGIYIKKKQIGYARVITDYAEFAYIVDVFISEGHRDKGLGKLLMEHILSFSELNTIKIWRLTTTDSHGFYQKFGFKELANTSRFMELVTKSKLEE